MQLFVRMAQVATRTPSSMSRTVATGSSAYSCDSGTTVGSGYASNTARPRSSLAPRITCKGSAQLQALGSSGDGYSIARMSRRSTRHLSSHGTFRGRAGLTATSEALPSCIGRRQIARMGARRSRLLLLEAELRRSAYPPLGRPLLDEVRCTGIHGDQLQRQGARMRTSVAYR